MIFITAVIIGLIAIIMALIYVQIKLDSQIKIYEIDLFIAKTEAKFGKPKISGAKKRIMNFLIKNPNLVDSGSIYKNLCDIKKFDEDLFKVAIIELMENKDIQEKNFKK